MNFSRAAESRLHLRALAGEKLAFLSFFSEAPAKYVSQVAQSAGIPEADAHAYVKNIRPHRFMISPDQFAKDIKPIWALKERQYNPLQKGLLATAPGSKEEAAYLQAHGKALDDTFRQWVSGQVALRKKYTGGDTMGEWKHVDNLLASGWPGTSKQAGALGMLGAMGRGVGRAGKWAWNKSVQHNGPVMGTIGLGLGAAGLYALGRHAYNQTKATYQGFNPAVQSYNRQAY